MFVWSIYAVSVVMLTATPVLAMDLLLLGIEFKLDVGLFDPARGGDPLLWQHMFWFYSHPAVYIMILPAMGVVSELIPCYARRPIFGYAGMVYALMSIAILSFFVWAHHMFTAGISIYSALIFSFMTFLVAVPSAIKVFNWTISLHKGQIHFDAPMLYALGFVLLFTTGGVTGLIIATLAVDVHMQDTYFIVAHFHYIMVGGTVSAFFGGAAFLVAEDHRPALPGNLGALYRDPHLCRLQPDLHAAVHSRLSRDAATVLCLSAGVAIVEPAVVGRRLDPRGRLCPAAVLSRLEHFLRAARRREPVPRHRARMDDLVAAAEA